MLDSPTGTIAGPNDYQKQQEAIKRAIGSAAKKSPTRILKNTSREMDTEAKKEVQMNCQMARTLFHEGLEMYEEGDMKFGDMVEDLYKSLKAIATRDSKE